VGVRVFAEEEEKEEDTRALKISHEYRERRRERRDALLFLRLSLAFCEHLLRRKERKERER
jgi:hypothetical protein